MKADISFYLDGTVEARLPQLTAPESPLRLEKKIEEFSYYGLRSKLPALGGVFIYGTPDSEIIPELLHRELQEALGFQPGCELFCRGCVLDPEKLTALKEIMNYLDTQGIPQYLTVTDEYGEETVIRGYNPITGIEVLNSHFNPQVERLE